MYNFSWSPNILNGLFILVGKAMPKSIHLAMMQFMVSISVVSTVVSVMSTACFSNWLTNWK